MPKLRNIGKKPGFSPKYQENVIRKNLAALCLGNKKPCSFPQRFQQTDNFDPHQGEREK
jgi:hypothetical protein